MTDPASTIVNPRVLRQRRKKAEVVSEFCRDRLQSRARREETRVVSEQIGVQLLLLPVSVGILKIQ